MLNSVIPTFSLAFLVLLGMSTDAFAQMTCRDPKTLLEVNLCREETFQKLDQSMDQKIREIRRDSTDEEDEVFDQEVFDWQNEIRRKCQAMECVRKSHEDYPSEE